MESKLVGLEEYFDIFIKNYYYNGDYGSAESIEKIPEIKRYLILNDFLLYTEDLYDYHNMLFSKNGIPFELYIPTEKVCVIGSEFNNFNDKLSILDHFEEPVSYVAKDFTKFLVNNIHLFSEEPLNDYDEYEISFHKLHELKFTN